MPEVSKEVIALLTYLLPGFLVAWLFYALTSHQKPSQQERIIQALIFTLIVNALVVLERLGLEFVGRSVRLGTWDKDAELIASVITSLSLGFAIAYLTNEDTVHRRLRKFGLSQRSSLPNEWCTVFSPREQFVVLHFKDDRRLFGWPAVWPSEPDKGHIFLTLPAWVHGETQADLDGTEGILVDVKEIAHIEFVAKPKETK